MIWIIILLYFVYRSDKEVLGLPIFQPLVWKKWPTSLMQLLQVFESHAEYLNAELFAVFALPYLKQISERVKAKISADIPMVRVNMVKSKLKEVTI